MNFEVIVAKPDVLALFRLLLKFFFIISLRVDLNYVFDFIFELFKLNDVDTHC